MSSPNQPSTVVVDGTINTPNDTSQPNMHNPYQINCTCTKRNARARKSTPGFQTRNGVYAHASEQAHVHVPSLLLTMISYDAVQCFDIKKELLHNRARNGCSRLQSARFGVSLCACVCNASVTYANSAACCTALWHQDLAYLIRVGDTVHLQAVQIACTRQPSRNMLHAAHSVGVVGRVDILALQCCHIVNPVLANQFTTSATCRHLAPKRTGVLDPCSPRQSTWAPQCPAQSNHGLGPPHP